MSFGPWAPGYINPLDGDIVVTDKRKTNVFDSILGHISCSEFLSQLIFFPSFGGMVMHANEFETKEIHKKTEMKN